MTEGMSEGVMAAPLTAAQQRRCMGWSARAWLRVWRGVLQGMGDWRGESALEVGAGVHSSLAPLLLERAQRVECSALDAATLPAAAPAGEAHAWHLFVLRLTDEARIGRDDLIDALARRGVGCSVHYVPLHRQPYWRDRYALRPEQFPQAEAAWQRMLSIPLFSAMSDEEQGRVIAALRAELA